MSDSETELIRKKWNRNRILWVHGLGSAVILGIAHSVTTVFVAPETFNFTTGLAKLAQVATASGVIGAFTYLAKSPLPSLPTELATQPKDTDETVPSSNPPKPPTT